MAKRRHKHKIRTVRVGEMPTPERKKQNGGIKSEVVDRDASGSILILRYKAVMECRLDAYRVRGYITEAEYQAGIKFRHAYIRGDLGLRVENIGVGSHGDPEMSRLIPIDSRKLLDKAYAALTPDQKSTVINVCGHDMWAGDHRLKTLCRGLRRLAKLWGF